MSKDACRSRSPKLMIAFVKLTMLLGRKHLSPYGSYKSRHDFTQPQWMTCLVLRAYWKTTYRGVIEQLEISGELRRAMGLRSLPNYSTLNKFAHRVGVLETLDAILGTLTEAAESADESRCKAAAMDATGLETGNASVHYVARSGKRRRQFVKLSVLVLCGSLIPASAVLGYGPGNDKTPAKELMDKAARSVKPDLLYADAGYDAEWVHRHCHEDWGVMPVIKPVQHQAGKPGGTYRSLMTAATLNAKTDRGRMIDTAMKVLAYAIRR